jgi:hypothetical protein
MAEKTAIGRLQGTHDDNLPASSRELDECKIVSPDARLFGGKRRYLA